MNKQFNKRLTAITLVLALIISIMPVWANQEQSAQQTIISPWAIAELHNAEMIGTLPVRWADTVNDYTKAISRERLNDVLQATEHKLIKLGVTKSIPTALELPTGVMTRRVVADQLHRLLAKFDTSTMPLDRDYLKNIGVMQGSGDALYLDQVCSEEQAIVMATRGLLYCVKQNGLGAKGFVWKAQHNGNTMYLLGSIHIANSAIHPFDQQLVDAFHQSDALVMELDMLKTMQNQAELAAAYINPEGTTLEAQLGTSLYGDVKAFFTEIGVDFTPFSNYKPWALNLVVQQLRESYNQTQSANNASGDQASVEEDNAILTKYGIDLWLNTRAYLMAKPVLELESMQDQINALDTMDMKMQIEQLRMSITELDTTIPSKKTAAMLSIEDYLTRWQAGDKQGFLAAYNQDVAPVEDTAFGQAMFAQRDARMADKLIAMLNQDGGNSYFVVVGAGHCFSKTNIITRLKAAGITVSEFY